MNGLETFFTVYLKIMTETTHAGNNATYSALTIFILVFWRGIPLYLKIKFYQSVNVSRLATTATLVKICPHFYTFLCKLSTFLNACISVKIKPAQLTPNFSGDFVNLGVLFLTIGSIFANPIIYRLVPSLSRYEIRQ